MDGDEETKECGVPVEGAAALSHHTQGVAVVRDTAQHASQPTAAVATLGTCPRISHVVHRHVSTDAVDATAGFPRVSSGIWQVYSTAEEQEAPRVTTAASDAEFKALFGAQVLLTQHAADKQSRSFRHIQQLNHPHVLALYGACESLFVCEDGWLLDAFIAREPRPNCVFRVLADVLHGLQSMHTLGFAHGSVDSKHMVVGIDLRGKLMAHFSSQSTDTSEPDPEDAGFAFDDEPADPDIRRKLVQDEVAFATCMLVVVEQVELPSALSPDALDHQRKDFDKMRQQLDKTKELLARVQETAKDTGEPQLWSAGAARSLELLANLEESVFGKLC